MGKEWLFEKYKKAFEEISDFIQPPASDITKYSYLESFGQYYIKRDREYPSKTLYAIFWRTLSDAKECEEYHKNKVRNELIKDKAPTIKQISNKITINKKTIPEQLKLF